MKAPTSENRIASSGQLAGPQRRAVSPVASLLTCAVLSLFIAHGATLQTIVYHQLTKMASPGIHPYGRSHAFSADGRKIAFVLPGLTATSSNLIYTVNFDGSGLTLADSSAGSGYAVLSISADGSMLAYFDRGILRVVNSEGGNARQILQVEGGFPDVTISPDGAQVYFSYDREWGTNPSSGLHEPGIYVINSDGTGLRQITGLSAIARFLGLTAADIAPNGYLVGWNGGHPYALSTDGRRFVCFVHTPKTDGWRLLGFDADGTGMREFPLGPDAITDVKRVAISGDGGTVGYYFQYGPCCSSGEELGVFDWAGGGKRVLASNYSPHQGSGGYGVRDIQLTRDGSKLLFGETSLLFDTDGSVRHELGWTARFAASRIMDPGFSYRPLLDESGSRVVFLSTAGSGVYQIATAEINPPTLGAAPRILSAESNPLHMVYRGDPPLWKLKVEPWAGIVPGGGAQAGIMLNGVAEPALWQGTALRDDGLWGDEVANDGIFSAQAGYFFDVPSIGPRTLRFKAEALGADGMHHATAIDIAPFFVLPAPPTGPAPVISFLTPESAPPGSELRIAGTGFDPIATNNIVLFGNLPARVVGANASGTELVVIVPSSAPGGINGVTVSSIGRTSASANVHVQDPQIPSLSIKMLAGVEIYGKIGANYRIEYSPQLDGNWQALTNIQLPANPYFWVDLSSTNQFQRFYRAVHAP